MFHTTLHPVIVTSFQTSFQKYNNDQFSNSVQSSSSVKLKLFTLFVQLLIVAHLVRLYAFFITSVLMHDFDIVQLINFTSSHSCHSKISLNILEYVSHTTFVTDSYVFNHHKSSQ